ncbi:MAG: 3'-5' exonuclease domain-containing protein 2 [Chlorobi bacterium]|nr:3'-5' exonuclease domain-containing protein 2 [Chlorobiota bacterium]
MTVYEKIPDDVINNLPVKHFEGEIYFISDKKSFDEITPWLKNAEILGFDTETKPAFKKGVTHKVALLQLATSDKAFLFKLDKTGLPDVVVKILENKNIIKTGVAIRDDLKALKKIKHFIPGGFVDLQTFSDKFGIADNGLKKLTANLLGFRISKGARLTDWSKKVYTDAQLTYAATDAWVSHEIYLKLLSLDKNINIITES